MTFCKHQMAKTNYLGEMEIVKKKAGKVTGRRDKEVGVFQDEEI